MTNKESKEGVWLVGQFERLIKKHRLELDPRLLLHIPNEGCRSARAGASLKAQGMRKGAPDYLLLVPSRGFHGLAIELKRKGPQARTSKEQRQYLEMLRECGYRAEVCAGGLAALKVICEYLYVFNHCSIEEG